MDEFIFDLQRFDDPTWTSTDSRTWTCTVGDNTYTVTCSVALSSVTGDPTGDTVNLTTSNNLSGATATITGTSLTNPAIFRFINGTTLYTPTAIGTNQSLVRSIAEGYSMTFDYSSATSYTTVTDPFRVVGVEDGTATYTDFTQMRVTAGGSLTVSANASGIPIFNMNGSTVVDNLLPSGKAIILSSGTLNVDFNYNRPIIFGEDGPEISLSFQSSTNHLTYKVVKNTSDDSLNVSITSRRDNSSTTAYINNFKIGNFTYTPNVTTQSYTMSMVVKDGKTYITTSNTNDTITYNGQTYKLTSGSSMTLVNENDGSNFYVKDLNKGGSFTISGNPTVTYTMGDTLLIAQYEDSSGRRTKIGNVTMVEDGEISADALDIEKSWLLDDVCLTDGTLTIAIDSSDSSKIAVTSGKNKAELSADISTLAIVNEFDKTDLSNIISYGTISRLTSDEGVYYSLEGVDGTITGNASFTSVTVKDNLPVQFNSCLANVAITVDGKGTTFASRDSLNSFTYQTVSSGVSVSSDNVSLISGTIHTENTDQTIAAGVASIPASIYSVSGYASVASASDGIDVIYDGTNVIVGDIDVGEGFDVQTRSATRNYSMLSAGTLLLEKTGTTQRVYDLGTISGTTGVNATLSALGSGPLVIAPTSGKVLEIGSTNTVDAVIFDSTSNPSTVYASIDADNSNYLLSTIRGAGTFSDGKLYTRSNKRALSMARAICEANC